MTSGILKRAIQETEKSDVKQFRIAAVIFRGKTILSWGNNAIRSHSKLRKKYQKWDTSVHAEQAAILKARRRLKGASILVIRINKRGELRMAKPCSICMPFIKHVGIKKIFYSNETGVIVKETL